MTLHPWPEDQLPDANTRKPPNYWLGFLLNLVFPGSGLAFIHRLGPTLLFFVAAHLLTGPFARLLFGPAVDRWTLYLWPALFIGNLVWYRNIYRAQHVEQTLVPPHLAWPLRFIGVWLTLLFIPLIQAGYAQGWLPTPAR